MRQTLEAKIMESHMSLARAVTRLCLMIGHPDGEVVEMLVEDFDYDSDEAALLVHEVKTTEE
jgi:hypothetical protein